MSQIKYISGDHQLLDRIEPLWEKLNQHHQSISTFFPEAFSEFTFTARKQSLLEAVGTGELYVDIAVEKIIDRDIGYCISTAFPESVGELESIYVEDDFRRLGIAKEMVKRSLEWMDRFEVKEKKVVVAFGNENAFDFYAKFGFYPRSTVLRQKNL